MVACCDTETSHEIIGNRPESGLELERHPKSLDAAINRYADDEGDIQPVDMLVPVRSGHGSFGDVRFLGVIFGVSVWL